MENRQRQVDVESMSDEQIDNLRKTLSPKLNEIIKEALAKADRYLDVYGMKANMQFEITIKEFLHYTTNKNRY